MKIRYGTKVYNPKKLRELNKLFGYWELGRHKPSVLEYTRNLDGSKKQINHYIMRYIRNPIYVKNAIQYMFGSFYRGVLGIFEFWNGELDRDLTKDLSDFLIASERDGSYWVRGAVAREAFSFTGKPWRSGYNIRPKKSKHIQKFTAAPRRMIWIRYDRNMERVDVEFWNEETWSYRLVEVSISTFENKVLPKIEFLPGSYDMYDVGVKVRGQNDL